MSAVLSPLFTWRSAIVSSDMETSVKVTALCLSLHMNERGGSCFPSVPTLASETSLSERGVRYALGTLVREGWIHKTEGGGNRSNRYDATTPEHLAPLQSVQGTPATSAGTPAVSAAEGVKEDVKKGVDDPLKKSDHRCPICDGLAFKGAKGLATHMRNIHEEALSERSSG